MNLVCLIGPYRGHVLEYSTHVGENLLQGGLARKMSEEEATAFADDGELFLERPTEPRAPERASTEKPGKTVAKTVAKKTAKKVAKKTASKRE